MARQAHAHITMAPGARGHRDQAFLFGKPAGLWSADPPQ
jgi:hypothetical protein